MSDEPFGNYIRKAREHRLKTPEQIAGFLGLTKEAYASLEAGSETFSLGEVGILVPYLRLLGADLKSRSLPPAAAPALPPSRADQDSADIVDDWIYLARTVASVMALSSRPVGHFQALGTQAPMLLGDIQSGAERLAKTERVRLKLGFKPIEDMAGLFKDHGALVMSADLPRWLPGIYLNDRMGSIAVVRASDPLGRKRFSLAHEFAHALHGAAIKAADPMRATLSMVPEKLDFRAGTAAERGFHNLAGLGEYFANMFASAFLMPLETISARLGEMALYRGDGQLEASGVCDLAAYFGVSFEAMKWRLKRTVLPALPDGLKRNGGRIEWRFRESLPNIAVLLRDEAAYAEEVGAISTARRAAVLRMLESVQPRARGSRTR
ncbi:MAG: ImmA/IrrE family metallo-endopeptidase [Xanthobacteraceae bacterium]|nr:ImmA/IrrE family metallo-endopeptidase [Xanthobacteraceae bacterium]